MPTLSAAVHAPRMIFKAMEASLSVLHKPDQKTSIETDVAADVTRRTDPTFSAKVALTKQHGGQIPWQRTPNSA
jgi:hypothetical protein